jgi:hypothetical protein
MLEFGNLPVRVDVADGALPVGTTVDVKLRDSAVAERVTPMGLVFDVSFAEGTTDRQVVPSGQVLLTLDYSATAKRFGADYASRLRVLTVPDCALDKDQVAPCQAGTPLITQSNDVEASHLTVDLGPGGRQAAPDPAGLLGDLSNLHGPSDTPPPTPSSSSTSSTSTTAPTTSTTDPGLAESPSPTTASSPARGTDGGSTGQAASKVPTVGPVDGSATGGGGTFALMSGTAGDGDYAATPLAGVGSGEVGLSSGSAEASYPIEVPPSPAGPVPSVKLTYSSAAVDGFTTDHNTQASEVGIGWDLNVGSIDRQYQACGFGLGDQCWDGENYTITLNGVTDQLVEVPGTTGSSWRLKHDPDWQVKRELAADLSGRDQTTPGSGAFFTVTTPDGTQYRFGRQIDGAGGATNSLWYVPVASPAPGQPCYFVSPDRMCREGWQVTDVYGNSIRYYYDTGINYYKGMNGLIQPWTAYDYVLWGRLARIEYTRVAPSESFNQKVVFWYSDRCTGGCSIFEYPDTPWDLLCVPGSTPDCNVTSPSFWTASRLSGVTTHVNDSGTWSGAIRTYALSQSYPNPAPPPV